MTRVPALLVFSDLDGTLLSHDSYSWAPAAPALAALRNAGCGLVLASSKTAAEIAPLRAQMGFEGWPAIVENGAGVLNAGATPDETSGHYAELRRAIAQMPEGFRGFGDMRAEEVAALTGLPTEAAALAKARAFTEPGVWAGSEHAFRVFLTALENAGISARRGGRFLTLSFGGTKADQMNAIINAARPGRTIALGDAPNDVEMLERADLGVIVKNTATHPLPPLPGEAEGRIIRTRFEGPEGWSEAVLPEIARIPSAPAQTREDTARHV